MMTLYNLPESGNAYKIRLLLAFLKLEYQQINVDIFDGQNKTKEFLKLNPRGQIPVLVDEENTIWDSQAILVYLARKYGGETWLPIEAAAMSDVMQWMAVAENELLFGLARARAVKRFARPWDLKTSQDYGRSGLNVLESGLKNSLWLAGEHPTIADVACYPYVSMAGEGDVSLEEYKATQAWLTCFEALPEYIHIDA